MGGGSHGGDDKGRLDDGHKWGQMGVGYWWWDEIGGGGDGRGGMFIGSMVNQMRKGDGNKT